MSIKTVTVLNYTMYWIFYVSTVFFFLYISIIIIIERVIESYWIIYIFSFVFKSVSEQTIEKHAMYRMRLNQSKLAFEW